MKILVPVLFLLSVGVCAAQTSIQGPLVIQNGQNSNASPPQGTNGQLQYNNNGILGGANISVDPLTQSFLSLGGVAPMGPPIADLRNQSFAGGIPSTGCDGTTDIQPVLQAAWNSLPPTGGGIYIPGYPSACWWANPNSFNWGTKQGYVTFLIYGRLWAGTTITIPKGTLVHFKGLGGWHFPGPPYSVMNAMPMALPGDMGEIYVRPLADTPVVGTLGTATPAAATSTFTPSSMTGIVPGAAITISANNLPCTVSSVSRQSNIAWAQLTGPCKLPPGVPVTVTGISDNTFNGTFSDSAIISATYQPPFLSYDSDYVLNTITWINPGANVLTPLVTSGTVTGFNEGNAETVLITTTTATTATAYFVYAHAATDQFGLVGVNVNNQSQHVVTPGLYLEDIAVGPYPADGTAIWLEADWGPTLKNVFAEGNACKGNPTSFPLEVGMADTVRIEGSTLISVCQPWGVHITQPGASMYPQSAGPVQVSHQSYIGGGFKIDQGGEGVSIIDSAVVDAPRGVVTWDQTNWTYQTYGWETVNLLSDNFYLDFGFATCAIYQMYPNYNASDVGRPYILAYMHMTAPGPGCITNDYFTGSIDSGLMGGIPQFYEGVAANNTNNDPGVKGVYNNGRTIQAEIRGMQAGMEPITIPHATLPVPQNSSSWLPVAGTCTYGTTTAPDGFSTAATVTGSVSNGIGLIYSYPVTPAVNDLIIFGSWDAPMPYNVNTQQLQNSLAVSLDTANSTHFYFWGSGTTNSGQALTYSFGYESNADQVWKSDTGIARIKQADGTAGNIRLVLPCQTNRMWAIWNPFMIYIKASEGIALKEVYRWRQQLVHGYVAPGAVPGQSYSNYPLVITPKTYANLPAPAASNAGSIQIISDSTAVTAEGQLCAGASTHYAMAMSDGTQWKCF